MIDVKTLKATIKVDMADLLRSDIEEAMRKEIEHQIMEQIRENIHEMIEKGYIHYVGNREPGSENHIGTIRINLIPNHELRRFQALEAEYERFMNISEKKKQEFFKKLENSKICYRCGKTIKGTVHTLSAEVDYGRGEYQGIEGHFCDDCIDKIKECL